MADVAPSSTMPARTVGGARVRTVRQPSLLRWPLRIAVVVYLGLLVIWPVAIVAVKTFARGVGPVLDALAQPEVVFAFELSASNAFWAVVVNTVFGVGISLLLVRYEFPGRRALSALIDLPLSVSPVVVGLALLLVYSGRTGWFGPTIERWGLQIIYAQPGMIMATAFVSLPLVVREVVPVLRREFAARRPAHVPDAPTHASLVAARDEVEVAA